jgi:hypothetical protein
MFQFLFNYKTKKLLKNTKREKVFLNWNNVHTILLVFDTADYEEVDAFVEFLEKKGKKVKAYAYRNKSDKYDYSDTPYVVISRKETNDWTGESIKELMEELKETKFDLALDLTLKRNAFLEYLFACANALLKVGYKKSNLPLCDFTITSLPLENEKTTKPVVELARQIVYYLSKIESID